MKVSFDVPVPQRFLGVGNLLNHAVADIRESWSNHKKQWLVVLVFILLTFLPRLLSLGSMLTIDEPLWRSRGDHFMKGLASFHFEQTLVAGQPGVTTAWLVGLASPYDSLAADQAAIALASGLLVIIATYFLTQLLGFWWGIIAGFVLTLDPFLLGHSRIAHTDALFALFGLTSYLSLLSGLIPTVNGQPLIRRYIAFSAFCAGLALLTKIFALILLPLLFVTLVFFAWRANRTLKSVVSISLLWLTMFVLTVYIFWPVLWLHADQAFAYLTERGSLHAEGTRAEETTSLWWYYAREAFFRLTPFTVIFFPLSILGLFVGKNIKTQYSVLFLLIATIWYGIILNLGSDKSDRYLLFSLLTANIVAIYGFKETVRWLNHEWRMGPRISKLLMALPVIAAFLLVLNLHPYYLAHYNWLYPIEEDHKLGWGEGLEQAATWITNNDPGARVASYYPRVFEYFYEGEVVALQHAENKDYVVLYRSMFERGVSAETDQLQEYMQQTPVHIVTINGLPYAWIYKQN